MSNAGRAQSSHILAATGLYQPFLSLKQALGEKRSRAWFYGSAPNLCWHQIKKIIKLFTGEKEEITSAIYSRIDMHLLRGREEINQYSGRKSLPWVTDCQHCISHIGSLQHLEGHIRSCIWVGEGMVQCGWLALQLKHSPLGWMLAENSPRALFTRNNYWTG